MNKEIAERRKRISDYLTIEKNITVTKLAKLLEVTPETIRKDLDFLEKMGVLNRVHGAAVLKEIDGEVPFEIRNMEAKDIKKKIAQESIQFIKDDSVLYIDSSSTALALGKLLKLKKNLTIFTNSFDLIPVLANSKHHIFLVGGEYYEPGKRIIGPYAIEMIKDIHFDLCICGMDGSIEVIGPATKASNEHVLISKVVKQSKKKMLIADASKFDKRANFKYADYSEFDIFVTSVLPSDIKDKLKIDKIIEVS